MSVHILDETIGGLPPEHVLTSELTVELLDPSEREAFDQLLSTRHYLKNPTAVGEALRYVAKYRGQWLALLVFCSPALHLKPREQWLHWDARKLEQRRHLLAQNSRFLILASAGQWPNLSSRILKLMRVRLSEDWRKEFGHPILALETFVDPKRFRGTCYKAAGWERLGPTCGNQRSWKDFYTDTKHPKELWVRALDPQGLEKLRSEQLPQELLVYERPLAPPCPLPTPKLESLWKCFRAVTDPRDRCGVRYNLASVLTIMALATLAGCKGPHAMADFAQGLNHGQRRRLRCRPRKDKPKQFDVPCERTFRRILELVKPAELKDKLVQYMQTLDPGKPAVIHLDGKVIKNARPAPAQGSQAPIPPEEIPDELQKPKADKALTLVNFITDNQRLIDQIAVPQDTNEEASVAVHWPQMDLRGVCITSDAAHTIKANCRYLSQEGQADYFFILKGNQPHALAKAKQAFTGDFPPSGQIAG